MRSPVQARGPQDEQAEGVPSNGKIHERHYLIFPESWKVDVCAGFDAKSVTALCLERGIIIPDKEGKAQSKKRPPGEESRRFYVVNFDSEGWEL